MSSLPNAETSHANQARTVDRSLLYLDGPTGASGIYVPMTRGRESNEAFVVIRGEETPADVVAEALSRTWIDRPAVAVRAELREALAEDAKGSRTRERQLLAAFEIRGLLQRETELDRMLAGGIRLDMARRQVASL